MKTGIEFTSIDYSVNKEKGVVACIMRVGIYGEHHKVIGKAKCSPEDSFDETKGRRIAESRAKKTVYKLAKNLYKEFIEIHIQCSRKFEHLAHLCDCLEKRENFHIHKLYNT